MQTVDLSTLEAAALTRWLFDRPVVQDPDKDGWRTRYSYYEVDQPEKLLIAVTSIFDDFKNVASSYSRQQIDEGIWAILGGAGPQLGQYLAMSSIPLPTRIAFIDSMLNVFAKVVTTLQPPWVETYYYMWWDLVCVSYWQEATFSPSHIAAAKSEAEAIALYEDLMDIASFDIKKAWEDLSPEDQIVQSKRALAARAAGAARDFAAKISPDQMIVLERMFVIIESILAIDNRACQYAALHGLGHLRHPKVKALVQSFIDENAGKWPNDAKEWLESCRDSTVL